MYSPQSYHLKVPRSRAANLVFRKTLLARCRETPAYRAAVLEMCRTDILFFVNAFVWQFNPNTCGPNSPKLGPFISWGFQDKGVRLMLDCVEKRKDLVFEKSREMGASWLILIVVTWFWLFHPMSKVLCISRNEKAVDEADDADSLFWKIDYILDHLPEWMIDKNDYNRKKLSFKNHKNGSQITGQASTGKAGVGGRALFMLIDEFSQIAEDWEVLERTSDTSGCRLFSGTHRGTNTAFHELCTKAANSGHLEKLVMHWTEHPDKSPGCYHFEPATQKAVYHDPHFRYPDNFEFVLDGRPTGGPRPGVRSPWYDVACQKKGTDRGVAADLDINPSGSVEQVFDALMIRELKARYARPPVWEGDLEFHPDDATPVRFNESAGGRLKLWCRVDKDGKVPAGRYVFGGDIAQGTGATPSCFAGANAETGEKVFEFVDSQIEPAPLGLLMVAVAKAFKSESDTPAKLAWEIPGPGIVFGKTVIKLGFRNVYFRTTDHALRKTVSDSPGWINNAEAMQTLVINYRDALRGRKYLNRSEHALQETLSFQFGADGYVYHTGAKDPKDPSAARVNHGDRVVADALCWKLVDELNVLARPGESPKDAPPPVGSLLWRMMIHQRADFDSADNIC